MRFVLLDPLMMEFATCFILNCVQLGIWDPCLPEVLSHLELEGLFLRRTLLDRIDWVGPLGTESRSYKRPQHRDLSWR